MIDAPDLDTALARSLNVQGLLPLATLRALLDRSRAARPGGPSLARLLLDHGHLDEAQVRDLLRPLLHPTAPSSDRLPKTNAWRAGATIGAYEIEDQIGAGGMGVVHRVRHIETGARYALKSVAASTPDELQRFLRETSAMSAVDGHANVARVHASGVEAGRAYLVMELASGGDLRSRLASGPLFNTDAAILVRDLALGVEHLHGRGVLHRDLKPSNILFDEQGTPKLVDFGLARLAQQESLTQTGEILGTPSYMAPEQALGDRASIDERTDVYGLGALLYHCLTGQPPSDGASLLAVLDAVVHRVPERPSRLVPTIDPRLDAIALRALQKRPQSRHPSASALAADLDAFLRGERAPDNGPRLAALAALALTLVLLTGLAFRSRPAAPSALVADPTSSPTPTATASRKEPQAVAAVGSLDWPAWRAVKNTGKEPARTHARLAYLESLGGVVLFGGRAPNGSILGDLAVWDPILQQWSPRGRVSEEHPGLLPERGRTEFGLAVHEAKGAIVVAGGIDHRSQATVMVRTWAPGPGWNHHAASLPPFRPARWGHELVYDSHRDVLYAFGGRIPAGKPTKGQQPPGELTNTLLRLADGDRNWTEVPASPRQPPPREQCALAYDPHKRRLVLFGGLGADKDGKPKVLGDLWTFDGRFWRPSPHTLRRPQDRRGARLVYLEHGHMLLLGGTPRPKSGPALPDVWLLAGTKWTDLSLGRGPPGQWGAAAAWDRARGVLVLTGGFGNPRTPQAPPSVLHATWELHGLETIYDRAQRGFDRHIAKRDPVKQLQRPGEWLAEAGKFGGLQAPKEAIQCCDKALALLGADPEHKALRAAILLRRGTVRQQMKHYERAIDDFTRALEDAPDLYEALSQRALVRHCQARYGDAIADLTRYLEHLPRPTEFYRRGAAKLALGQSKLAITDFNSTLAGSTPREQHHKEATQRLREIRAAQAGKR